MALKNYRGLDSWKVGMQVVERVYLVTRKWPAEERFGLTSQAQRAAVSIPANVAEGYGRNSRKDYLKHLTIARSSLMELETHIQIAVRVGVCAREDVIELWKLCQQLGRVLYGHMKSLRRQRSVPPSPPQTPNPTPHTPAQ